ncbi:hypothetical protein [Corynebacterium freiburgense]|uniref:hypothetical protein n=1 Tax=Corynebacterium freiburgense TaxID=556548 RepID=UPI00047DDBC7|nr:hypothetical protein [Corynebacterium freiburgense]WJZ03809.1 hypothetical protein CFREI_12760 [Corynebacterium freiburgense]
MHKATAGDTWSGTLIFTLGLMLCHLCWSGLVFRYVQPGFRWAVLATGFGLLILGTEVLRRVFLGSGLGHGSWITVLLVVPVVLVALAAPGPLLPRSGGVQVVGSSEVELPELHNDVNDMTVLDFPLYSKKDIEGKQVRMIGQVTEVEDGWMLTRYRVLCCAADATLHGVKMIGSVPDADWVVVTGVVMQDAVYVHSAAPIIPPERPYL